MSVITGYKRLSTLTVLLVMLVACGGGQTNTTSAGVSDNPGQADTIGSAVLNWVAPSIYEDGSPIVDLGGHNIYIDSGNGFELLATINNPGILTYVVENLTPGTYSFVVTAFDLDGIESSFSKEANITI